MEKYILMDDLIKMADSVIKYSRAQYETNEVKYSNSRWKYCVAMIKCGWEAYHTENISNSDDVIIKWRKEGRDDVSIQLSFTEQCMWLKYMEKESKITKEDI